MRVTAGFGRITHCHTVQGFSVAMPRRSGSPKKSSAIARQRGVPACIYRPGVISGDSRTGMGNTKDLIWSIIKGCIQLGVMPDLDTLPDIDTMINITPVDYVSRAIVQLSRQPASLGASVPLLQPATYALAGACQLSPRLRLSITPNQQPEWYEVLFSHVARSPENALFPFMPLFAALRAEEEAHGYTEHAKDLEIDCRNTLKGLADSGITCPPVDGGCSIHISRSSSVAVSWSDRHMLHLRRYLRMRLGLWALELLPL